MLIVTPSALIDVKDVFLTMEFTVAPVDQQYCGEIHLFEGKEASRCLLVAYLPPVDDANTAVEQAEAAGLKLLRRIAWFAVSEATAIEITDRAECVLVTL